MFVDGWQAAGLGEGGIGGAVFVAMSASVLRECILDVADVFLELFSITLALTVVTALFAPAPSFLPKYKHTEKDNQRHKHGGPEHDQKILQFRGQPAWRGYCISVHVLIRLRSPRRRRSAYPAAASGNGVNGALV